VYKTPCPTAAIVSSRNVLLSSESLPPAAMYASFGKHCEQRLMQEPSLLYAVPQVLHNEEVAKHPKQKGAIQHRHFMKCSAALLLADAAASAVLRASWLQCQAGKAECWCTGLHHLQCRQTLSWHAVAPADERSLSSRPPALCRLQKSPAAGATHPMLLPNGCGFRGEAIMDVCGHTSHWD